MVTLNVCNADDINAQTVVDEQNKSFLGWWFIVFGQLFYSISSEELFTFSNKKRIYAACHVIFDFNDHFWIALLASSFIIALVINAYICQADKIEQLEKRVEENERANMDQTN